MSQCYLNDVYQIRDLDGDDITIESLSPTEYKLSRDTFCVKHIPCLIRVLNKILTADDRPSPPF